MIAAPGQSSDFIKSAIDETDISFKEDREILEDLKNLIQIYEKSDTHSVHSPIEPPTKFSIN